MHSLVYGLARFGARVIPSPAPGCDLPDHVKQRLARDFHCFPLRKQEVADLKDEDFPEFVYVTPEGPHQRTLWTGAEADLWFSLSLEQRQALREMKEVDFFYATRFQKERHDDADEVEEYPAIDAEMMKAKRYRQTKVLHPLPRVDELSYEFDESPAGRVLQAGGLWRAGPDGADRCLARTLPVLAWQQPHAEIQPVQQ